MKMVMRLQPGQVPSSFKFVTPGAATLDLALAKLAGVLHYEAILVGGGGGKSGYALNYTGEVSTGRSGGGGGGSLRLSGNVADLPMTVPVAVGAQGAIGANGAANAKAGNGAAGGDSSFNTAHVAHGGGGGIGGDWDGGSSSGSFSGSVGGAGGTNSAGLGAGGAGGDAGFFSYGPGGSPDGGGATSATTGTYVAGGAAPVTGGGRGGGGGRPRIIPWITDAAGGAIGNSALLATPGSAKSGNDGGYGGGADINAVFASGSEIHGTASAVGIVWVKLS